MEGIMVVKVNVSMPEEILEKLDKAAADANTSRSAFLTEAVKRFLEEKAE
jgi:metal-responsive CopG/Arc/MetJ family transcriptional regulator